MGPFLIFCSEDDEFASCQTIFNFAQRLKELGGDVKLVKWSNSPHIGEFLFYFLEFSFQHDNLVRQLYIVLSVIKDETMIVQLPPY